MPEDNMNPVLYYASVRVDLFDCALHTLFHTLFRIGEVYEQRDGTRLGDGDLIFLVFFCEVAQRACRVQLLIERGAPGVRCLSLCARSCQCLLASRTRRPFPAAL